jgi:hypothetical protein
MIATIPLRAHSSFQTSIQICMKRTFCNTTELGMPMPSKRQNIVLLGSWQFISHKAYNGQVESFFYSKYNAQNKLIIPSDDFGNLYLNDIIR